MPQHSHGQRELSAVVAATAMVVTAALVLTACTPAARSPHPTTRTKSSAVDSTVLGAPETPAHTADTAPANLFPPSASAPSTYMSTTVPDVHTEAAPASTTTASANDPVVVPADEAVLRYTASGTAYYVDGVSSSVPTAQAATPSISAAQLGAEAFRLHSKPGSSKTIYINFVGADLSNTLWTSSADLGSSAVPAGFYPGYDTNGDPNTYTREELNAMFAIWSQVAEDYSAFDVDVTTEPPGAAALDRSSGADTVYGSTVLVTSGRTASAPLCSNTCAGIAVVGGYNMVHNAYYQPALVFSDFTPTVTLTAETITHEVGHNLGLSHDGTSSSSYYEGTNGWSPIMGFAAYPISQWSSGMYPDANNTEDDLSVISANGLPRRGDDYGNTITAAAPLGTFAGVISDRNDVDVISLGTCSGTLSVSVTSASLVPDLDAQLEILASDGSVLVTNNPVSAATRIAAGPTGMGAQATISTSGDSYYARIDGVGRGTWANGGYDDYGSIGQYQILSNCSSGQVGAAPTGQVRINAGDGDGDIFWTLDDPSRAADITSWTVRTANPQMSLVLGPDARYASVFGLSGGQSVAVSVEANWGSPQTSTSIGSVTVEPHCGC